MPENEEIPVRDFLFPRTESQNAFTTFHQFQMHAPELTARGFGSRRLLSAWKGNHGPWYLFTET